MGGIYRTLARSCQPKKILMKLKGVLVESLARAARIGHRLNVRWQIIQSVGLGLSVLFFRVLLPDYVPMVIRISSLDVPARAQFVRQLGAGNYRVLGHA